MRRPSRGEVAAALGAVLVVGTAVAVAEAAVSGTDLPEIKGWVAALVAVVVGLAATAWRLRAGGGPPGPDEEGDDLEPPERPERSTVEAPIAGQGLAALLSRAGREAREGDTAEDGVEVVRPALREALGAALVQGGTTVEEARTALDEGTWTDDPEAAAVLSSRVEPPPSPFRRRLWAWLYPERAVARRVDRAVQAVAEAADEALPAVPGQTAPRTVPVTWPSVDRLRDGVEAPVRPAIDPGRVERGGPPPAPTAGEVTDE